MDDNRIKCPNCGKKIADRIPFCPFCGAKQQNSLSKEELSKNPYEILQVSPDAEPEVIEAAYKSLARKYHPDTLSSSVSEERMLEINWAHSILKNPDSLLEWKRKNNQFRSSNSSSTESDSSAKKTTISSSQKPSSPTTPDITLKKTTISTPPKPPLSTASGATVKKTTIPSPQQLESPPQKRTSIAGGYSRRKRWTSSIIIGGVILSGLICLFTILALINTNNQTIVQSSNPTKVPPQTYIPSSIPKPNPTPSPPPDIRVINSDPQTLLLSLADLPANAGYIIPGPDWMSPNYNFEVSEVFGIDRGKQYIERTGRIMGWWVDYYRSTKGIIAPQELYDNVILFKAHEGALIYLEEYTTCDIKKDSYIMVEAPPNIGDASIACINKIKQPSGEYKIDYVIAFVYRNIAHQVSGSGLENEVSYDYIHLIAETLLAQLKTVPLSENVTFSP